MKHKKIGLLSLILAAIMLMSAFQTSTFAFTQPGNQEVEDILKSGYSDSDTYQIYPAVQRMETNILTSDNEFTIGEEVNVVYESDIDIYTQNFLEEVLNDYGRTVTKSEAVVEGKMNILLGVRDSEETADEYLKSFTDETIKTEKLFEKNDAYVLTAVKDTISIVGRDTDAVFRGVATLQMMFSSFAGTKFISAFIEDYAVVEYRGFIEGMYARWNDEGRESLMRFARDVKMNTYVYASKNDVYHTSSCTELYPKEQIDAIADLVQVGLETKCYYGWSFHLSGFLRGLDTSDEAAFNTKFDKLIKKLEQLYDVGVRKFDVLNDDFGAGTNADVVKTLNRLNEEFIIPKGCKTMAYCPQGYNKAWAGDGTELESLKELDDNIMIFWTGDDVNSPMTQSTVNYAKEKTGHDVCTWLNYPVNEHAQNGIYLGDITHYANDGVTGQRGALSNPCLYPEASKVALWQLACLWWNNNNYLATATKTWKDSFKYLQPEVYDAYSTIAANVANCPNSGRVPAGFNESEYIKENLESVLAKIQSGDDISSDSEVEELISEFEHISGSVDVFTENCSNDTLIDELDSWLSSLADIADSCKSSLEAYIASQNDEISESWNFLSDASSKMSTWDSYTYLNGQNNPTVSKAGSKRLYPFATEVISEVNSVLMPILDPDNDYITPKFIGRINGNDITPGTESNKAIDSNDSTFAAFNSKQLVDDYVGLDLGRVIKIKDVRILLGNSDTDHDIVHDGVIEYSTDKVEWTPIETVTSNYLHVVDGLNIDARYIRLRVTGFNNPNNPTKLDYWLHLREFAVNSMTSAETNVLTNVKEYENIDVTEENNVYSAVLPEAVFNNKGDYFGIDLGKAYFYSSVEAAMACIDGMNLQYSANGVVWKDEQSMQPQDVVRYVRMINPSNSAIKFTEAEGGDVNNDGIFNIKDITLIQKYSADIINSIDMTMADINSDGSVDGNDTTAGQKVLIHLTEFADDYMRAINSVKLDVTVESKEIAPYMMENNLSNQTLKEGAWSNVFDGSLTTYAWTNVGQVTGQYITFDLGATVPVHDVTMYFSDNPFKPRLYYAKIQISSNNSDWTDIKTFNNNPESDYELNGIYRVARCDGNGKVARYMRIYITQDGPENPFIRIQEIEINKMVDNENPVISGTLTGNLTNIVDGNLTTVYKSAAATKEGDYINYIITDNVELESFKIIQSGINISHASVSIVDLNNTSHNLGTLEQSVNSFNVSDYNGIQEIKLTFPAGETPEIYEITKQAK